MGIFRLDRDLLSGKPDLVFIEFSVNDAGTDYNEIITNAETILRKIYLADPHTDIVFIHTMTRGMAENLASGGEYVSRGAYSTVMQQIRHSADRCRGGSQNPCAFIRRRLGRLAS